VFSASVEAVLHIAFREAVSRRHAYFTLEHLLYALAHDPDGERILKGCGADVARLRRDLHDYLDQSVEKLKRDRIIRHFGLSLNRWEPDNGLKALHTGLVDAVQVIHNIFDQAPEDNLYPLCEELNVGVIARVPLDEGSLGGKMTMETKFPKGDWRAMYFGPKNLGPTIERVEKLKAMLPQGMTLPQMALRYILSFPAVSTIIVGMRKPEHVRQNIAASDEGPLDAALLQKLKVHRWDRKPEPWAD